MPVTVIAIDGPVAAGKGTLARQLAGAFGLAHLDTGMIYRAVAAKVLSAGGDPSDPEAALAAARALTRADLERDDLRREAVGQGASIVAAMAPVRDELLAFQRRFAEEGEPGAVLDGRDIGTVVCPGAKVKFFVTASVESRARRRHKELLERGEKSIYARVLRDLQDRDARDSGRQTAPLRPAEDAIKLDTTEMDAEAAFEAAVQYVLERSPDLKLRRDGRGQD